MCVHGREILFLEGALISTSIQESGRSGDLTINTPRLVVRDRATVTTFPFTGEGGDLTIDATEIFLQGKASISTGTLGQDAGDLKITSDRITLRDGGKIGTTTFGSGNAGNFNLVVDELSIGSNSSIGINTFAAGDGGILSIESNSTEIIGTSTNSLISNGINATSLATGDAGSIDLKSDRLTLTQGGEITTATIDAGSGGNIAIDTGVLESNNGRINASTATASPGGNINITTQQLFGLEFRPELTQSSDITASSEFGIDGTIDFAYDFHSDYFAIAKTRCKSPTSDFLTLSNFLPQIIHITENSDDKIFSTKHFSI